MNAIVRFLLVTVFAALAIGCARDEAPGKTGSTDDGLRTQAQPANNAMDAGEYIRAEVKMIHGDLAGRTKRIEDQAEIRRLLAQFPGAGSGIKGPEPPAPWVNAVVIQFTRADDTVLRVTSSAALWNKVQPKENELYFWSEGQDDWLVEDPKEFRSYFLKLFEEDSKSEKQNEP